MIDLYSANTPNGQKIHILVEELGTDYRLHRVDLAAGEQRRPEYLRLNPNGKIPVIVDRAPAAGDELVVFESGAILLYLADKTGRLLPARPARRWQAVQWLMVQMSAVGPMMGQNSHFTHAAPESLPYAVDRFLVEVERLYGVANSRLAEHRFLADEYSVADIACFPWMRRHSRQGVDIDDFPHVARWLAEIDERPAVQRGLGLMA